MSPGAHMTMATGEIRQFSKSRLYDDVSFVSVDVGGVQIEVPIDPEYGPLACRVDGSPPGPNDAVKMTRPARCHLDNAGSNGQSKPWSHYTSTEREIAVHMAAKTIKARMARLR
eukprot:TRINITY_DN10585_c3_g3_i1.p1 TRINITY_DN10585_c3_g3~~TRINITY_DN10585_c3_g3_i1.p1  ORF type:complete len:114 (+),score=21.97 TRINITY_DN10585_c3_g3_i1:92-433(+)